MGVFEGIRSIQNYDRNYTSFSLVGNLPVICKGNEEMLSMREGFCDTTKIHEVSSEGTSCNRGCGS